MNIFNFISRILQIRKLNTEEKRLEDSSQLQDYTQLHHKEIEEAKKRSLSKISIAGKLPIYERGVSSLIRENVRKQNLILTGDSSIFPDPVLRRDIKKKSLIS